jgi:hypothetical protein
MVLVVVHSIRRLHSLITMRMPWVGGETSAHPLKYHKCRSTTMAAADKVNTSWADTTPTNSTGDMGDQGDQGCTGWAARRCLDLSCLHIWRMEEGTCSSGCPAIPWRMQLLLL